MAFDLDVPLLHDIEQGDLDLGGEIGELVDRKNPSVGPGEEAKVNGQRTAKVEAGPGRPDGVDITDQISHRHVRSRKFLYVASIARDKGDGGIICHRDEPLPAVRTERRIGVVMDLTPFDGRDLHVQKGREASENPALCLSPKPEEDHVVSRQDGVDDLGYDGFLVSHDSGKERLPRLYHPDQVLSHLILDRSTRISILGELAPLQGSQRRRFFLRLDLGHVLPFLADAPQQ